MTFRIRKEQCWMLDAIRINLCPSGTSNLIILLFWKLGCSFSQENMSRCFVSSFQHFEVIFWEKLNILQKQKNNCVLNVYGPAREVTDVSGHLSCVVDWCMWDVSDMWPSGHSAIVFYLPTYTFVCDTITWEIDISQCFI